MENGIPYEVVPGISSAIAGPAYAGIPVTHRGHNTAVTFLTGHRWDASRIKDTYSSLSGTLVILMGASSFPDIARDLMGLGYDAHTPVASIHNATMHSQDVLSGTLEEMASRQIPSPSVIIVDGAADGDGRAQWFMRKLEAFRGRRVVIMRAPEQYEETRSLLEEVGAVAVNGGSYSIVPRAWDRHALERATHVVVTSANTVPLVKDTLMAHSDKTYVAIGPGTRRALEGIGITAEMPDEYTSEGLGMLLKSITMPGDAVVSLRSSKASDVLSSMLSHLDYTELPVYDIGFERIDETEIQGADIIFFTSSAMVDAIAHLVHETHLCISIGPQTTRAMRQRGVAVDMQSTSSTIPSMIAVAMDVCYSKQGNR
jgi:uroporphyrinogen III methyltransferase/synthase